MRAYPLKKQGEICALFTNLFTLGLLKNKVEEELFLSRFIESGVEAALSRGELPEHCLSTKEVYSLVMGVPLETITNEDYSAEESDYLYSLARYQFESGRSFREILRVLPPRALFFMRPNSAEEVGKEVERRIRLRPTMLEYFRSAAGLSQAELAEKSGVDIRSIQTYEQRRNDLSRAQSNIVHALCRALNCTSESLLEEFNDREEKGIVPESPADAFVSLCLTDLNRILRSESIPNFLSAQKNARKAFYANGFFVRFPREKVTFEKGKYSLEKGALSPVWEGYFLPVLESKKAPLDEKLQARAEILSLLPKEKKLSPNALVTAVLEAVDVIERI